MTSRLLLLLSLALWPTLRTEAQSLVQPRDWSLAQLVKLDRPCVRVWSYALDRKKRVAKDSTLVYCLCYDTATRSMDAVHWRTMCTNKGRLDTLARIDMHCSFTADGDRLFDVEREHRGSWERGPAIIHTTIERQEFREDGLPIRRIGTDLQRSSINNGTASSEWEEELIWSIDSSFFEGSVPVRSVTYSKYCSPCDSTVYERAPDGSWSRSVQYDHTGMIGSSHTTILHRGKPVLEVDSSFFPCEGKRVGVSLMERRTFYQGPLLMTSEETEWHRAYAFDQRQHPDGKGPCPTLKYKPWRRFQRYVHDGDRVVGYVQYEEKSTGLESTVHVLRNGYFEPEGQVDPVELRLPSGLPLRVVHAHRRLVFEYMDQRPSELLTIPDLDALRASEPR